MGIAGCNGWWKKKGVSEDDIKISSYADYKNYLKNVVREIMKQSDMNINEILDMPFSFFMDIVEEENEPEEKDSLIKAFGG